MDRAEATVEAQDRKLLFTDEAGFNSGLNLPLASPEGATQSEPTLPRRPGSSYQWFSFDRSGFST